MKRFLLSGFLPFETEPVNPSGEAARALHGMRVGDVVVCSVVLPVTYAGAVPLLLRAVQDLQPVAVLSVGQGRDAFRVETVARNHVAARADMAGHVPLEGPLDDGEDTLPVRLDTQRMVSAVRAALPGVACESSADAGSYVCNHVLRGLLRGTPAGLLAGFLHVPRLSAARQAVVTRGVMAAVEDVVRQAV